MKRLLILTVLTALTAATAGCCGLGSSMGGCFGRRDTCAPAFGGCNECGGGCDSCGAGAVGAPVMTAPPVVTPGPAYSTGYLPR